VWDRKIYHGKWSAHIGKAVSDAKCIIPIWSKDSINPDKLVINEAKIAQDLGKNILSIRIDPVNLPLLFNTLHPFDFTIWNYNPNDEIFRALVAL